MKFQWQQWLHAHTQRTLAARRSRKRAESSQRAPLSGLESLESRQLLTGDVSGTVFHDANANGIDEPTENGLAEWTVFVDSNGDGVFNSGETFTTTDEKGKYAILGLPAGNTSIYEIPQEGWTPTPGFTDHQSVTVRDGKEARVKFPNITAPVLTGRINGSVFEDLNENGIRESGEDGLEGWTVFIDADGNGTLSATDPVTTTDTDGDYLFAGLSAGAKTVFEIPLGGLFPTKGGLFPLDGASDHKTVNVTADASVRADFGNLLPQVGTINATVWNDQNGDGLLNGSETPLAGRDVFVDLNANGTVDAGEPVRTSDATGKISFTNIHTGTYRVTNVLPAGWIVAESRSAAVNLTVSRGGTYSLAYPNLVPVTGTISGSVWDDADGNGLRGVTEQGTAGWQVFLDRNQNGLLDDTEQSTTTAADGTYSFLNVPYGTTAVRTVIPSTWVGTAPVTGSTAFRLLNGENRTGVNFGVRERVGNIVGTIWNDANGDRLASAGETGLADWTVYLDSNSNGVLDVGEPSTVSAADGSYRFTKVPVGTWKVTEVPAAGWSVSEGKSTTSTVNVVIGGNHQADFFNLVPVNGTVSGRLFSDQNSNGIQDATEIGLEGWQVYSDSNANGLVDAGESSAITNALGDYTLSNVAYGTSRIREIIQTGYSATNRPGGLATIFLLNGENRGGVDFGNHEATDYSISGTAFFDANHNGVLEASERGLDGITIYLDLNNNGTFEATEPSTATLADRFFTPTINEAGTYTFGRLARGTYHVREVVPAELDATPAASRELTITVGPGSQTGADFANIFRSNEIHGVVFDDTDADGSWDASEYARPGVTMYVDLNRNDLLEADEPSTVTADDGSYAFTGLTPGAYIVREHSGTVGPHTYPVNTGGVLWPTGTSNPAIGNVTPSSITAVLGNGETLRQTVSLTLPGGGSSLTNLVDVFLLFDDTGSFTGNSPIVRSAFPTIISTLQAALPGIDLGFGVGRFEEYAGFASEFGSGRPFTLNQPIVSLTTPGFSGSIQAALDRTAPGYGGDAPETDIEALYQLVTGLGFDGNNNGSVRDSGAAGLSSTQTAPGASGDVPDFASFTPDPANQVLAPSGSVGGGGFRAGALPIILTATDTGFAYQPKGETTITGSGGVSLPVSALTQASRGTTPFSSGAGLQETVTGLNALGALVIGLGTNPQATLDPRLGLESLATLTGAVNRSTSTIANGTADPIAPGDPFYFQIASGFATTVADGIVNAIQNAVTNIAMDITVRSSDPRVRIVNYTGTINGVTGGQTASFDVEFTGDGRPHRFDLQFVRQGTDVVLGSIPVVLGTAVAGEGYSYDELEDGEIHHSSHFGNYIANVAPEFIAGASQTFTEDAGTQTIANWATGISPGPAREARQTVNFLLTNDNPTLFSVQPSVSSDGTLLFTPAPNASGTATITIRAQDNGGIGTDGQDTSAPQTFVITITPVNDAPVAANDGYSVSESDVLTVAASGLLANDVDPEGNSISATLVAEPLHGTVVLNANGSFVYTPTAGYSGPDSFTYTATDGLENSAIATVAIEVLPINHAPIAGNDTYSVAEDSILSIDAPGILTNDSDPDGNSLTIIQVTDPAHGTLTINPDGSIVYTPTANYFGTDTFSYKLNDGRIDSNIAVVTLQVTAVNDTPVAVADTYAATEDVALTVGGSGILLNDSDADGDVLSVIKVVDPAHGTLTLNANGTFTYVPDANYNGADSFVYRVSDGVTVSADTTVTINVAAVNDAPVAVPDSYSTAEDTPLSVTLPGLLANDSDVEGSALSAIRVSNPLHGTLTLNANGTFTYIPAANYNGADSFTYRVSDGVLSSATVTVALSVTAVNDRPVAGNDSFTIEQDQTLSIAASGLLVNDSDPDGDALTASLVSAPANGTVTVNANGSFVYTPSPGYFGSDSFTYQSTDPSGLSSTATVTIAVTAVVPGAKFFVADLDTRATYRYSSSGGSLGNSALNKSDSKPRGIASNATGSTQWVVDGSGTVFVYNKDGGLLGQWSLQNIGKPEGITVWGNDLWLVDPAQDRVFYFAGGALLRSGRVAATSSFALNSANLSATDLVSDGSHLWVVNDTTGLDQVFRYTNGGLLEGSWTLSAANPSPTGITLDPNNVSHLWVVDASTDRVYQYNAATTRLSGTQEPGLSFALAAGNTNPQGIADPLAADEPAGVTASKDVYPGFNQSPADHAKTKVSALNTVSDVLVPLPFTPAESRFDSSTRTDSGKPQKKAGLQIPVSDLRTESSTPVSTTDADPRLLDSMFEDADFLFTP